MIIPRRTNKTLGWSVLLLTLLALLSGVSPASAQYRTRNTPLPANWNELLVERGLLPFAAEQNSAFTSPFQAYGDRLIETMATRILLNTLNGIQSPPGQATSIETDRLCYCITPNTPPERVEELLRGLPSHKTGRNPFYGLNGRWASTVTNGNTGSRGNPITLTYSFVPDGTPITPSKEGESSGGSNLYDVMSFLYFSADSNVWKNKFRQVFTRWGQLCGIRYVEVGDDGAVLPASGGVAGVRGDVRISGHSIDGKNGIAAYNYFPENGGDMVLDSSIDIFSRVGEDWANDQLIRWVVGHEHGHGMGLLHVLPRNGTKLMEAIVTTGFTDPQDDDIRGAQRNYGDAYENNDTAATATDLGTLTQTVQIDTLSTDGNGDLDWFRVTKSGDANLSVTVTPVGATYEISTDPNPTFTFNSRAVNRLTITVYASDGNQVLGTATATNPGDTVSLTVSTAALPGSFLYVQVSNPAGAGDDIQRYSLSVSQAFTALYVDKNAVGPELGTPENPYHTETTAINAATPTRRTLYVRAANYNELFASGINKNVEIRNWGNFGTAAIGTP